MKDWQVFYAGLAEQDLRDIYEYIAFVLLEPNIAKNQAQRIITAVAGLRQLPLRHPLYEREPWRSRGLRVLPVDNYLAFYLPVESTATVAVLRVIYGGRDIDKQLEN